MKKNTSHFNLTAFRSTLRALRVASLCSDQRFAMQFKEFQEAVIKLSMLKINSNDDYAKAVRFFQTATRGKLSNEWNELEKNVVDMMFDDLVEIWMRENKVKELASIAFVYNDFSVPENIPKYERISNKIRDLIFRSQTHA